jgi:uncharacterized membrane protein YfcA
MGSKATFWLAEAFREAAVFPKLLLVLVLVFGLVSQSESTSPFTVDPKFMVNCTQQLQCGSRGLICLEGACQYCTENAQCQEKVQNLYRCMLKGINSTAIWEASPNSTERYENYGVCLHKPLFKPFHWRDILTALILFVGSCVAAGAGVGGGGLNVAMLVFIDAFTTTSAIPLSSVMIGGAAIANFVHALPRQRLTAPRPLIDYHTMLLLQPLTMGGSVVGILLNRVFPDWLILLILIIVLGYTLYTTSIKFLKSWRADYGKAIIPPTAPPQPLSDQDDTNQVELETQPLDHHDDENGDQTLESVNLGKIQGFSRRAFDSESELSILSSEEDRSPRENEDQDSSFDPSTENSTSSSTAKNSKNKEDEVLALLEKEEQKIPFSKLWMCFAILIVITVHSIFLGGKGGPSVVGIRTCSALYWLLLWGMFPILGLLSWLIGRQLVSKYHLKRSHGFQFLHSDIEWTDKRTYITMVVALGAGTLSSLLGVGGGMLVNPLLLELGVAPDCTAATSSLMILFTSISAIAQYGVLGRIQWDYAAFLFILGLAGSVVGQHVLGTIVKKYKSQSWILLAMLLIIVPGGILLIISASTQVAAGFKAGTGLGFKKMCSA